MVAAWLSETREGGGSGELSEAWIRANSKPCPKCAVLITRERGCLEMDCNNCSAKFCYACGMHGAPWKKTHYEAVAEVRDTKYRYILCESFSPFDFFLLPLTYVLLWSRDLRSPPSSAARLLRSGGLQRPLRRQARRSAPLRASSRRSASPRRSASRAARETRLSRFAASYAITFLVSNAAASAAARWRCARRRFSAAAMQL